MLIFAANFDPITVNLMMSRHGRSVDQLPAGFTASLGLVARYQVPFTIGLLNSLFTVTTLGSNMLAVVHRGFMAELLVTLRIRTVVFPEPTFRCGMCLDGFSSRFLGTAPIVVRAPDHQIVELSPHQPPRTEALGPDKWLSVNGARRSRGAR